MMEMTIENDEDILCYLKHGDNAPIPKGETLEAE
jgi:hypothetical protein